MKKKHKRFRRKMECYMKRSKKNFYLTARKITLFIIIAAAIVIGVALLLCAFLDPEARTKRQIESMARDYYETYYYANFSSTSPDTASFEKYAEKGFPTVTLRQLLLFDGGRYQDSSDFLTKYCDENRTTVQIFPEDPYAAKNYRIDFNYSCEF